jgi:hypothetical protein
MTKGRRARRNLKNFGKNFSPSSQVLIQSSNLAVYPLMPSHLDSNSIAVPVPATIAPGKYNIWVGSYPWSPTSSPASQITIYPPPSREVRYATCSNLVGDGVTDNSARLQACLDLFAPPAGSNLLVYITIPAGKFVLKSGVKPHSYEFLDGVSPNATRFLGSPRPRHLLHGSRSLNILGWLIFLLRRPRILTCLLVPIARQGVPRPRASVLQQGKFPIYSRCIAWPGGDVCPGGPGYSGLQLVLSFRLHAGLRCEFWRWRHHFWKSDCFEQLYRPGD